MFLFQFPRFITNMALNINVKVHPVALFQIVDSYERRNADSYRVIGTLLGNVEKGTVEVTNCFCVPHREYDTEVIFMFLTLCCCIEMDSHASNERLANNGLINMAPQGDDSNNADSDSVIVIKPSGDENYNIQESFHVHIDPISLQVEAELVYAAELRDLNQRVNSQEVVVGWWATGNEVTRHSSLIHDYYTIECPNSIHLTLDTTLQGGNMGIKAYVRVPIGVPGGNNGNMFTSVPVEIACYEPEVVGLQLCSRTLGLSKRAVEPMQELAQVSDAARKLLGMLDIVLDYVSDVLASRSNTTPPDNTVGRALLDMVHSVPKMSHEEFENMLNSNIKDLLMVICLSQLTKTQLQLNEKLTLLTTL